MASNQALNGIEALLFDVFGTVVDWRGSVSKALQELSPSVEADWDAFTVEWRSGYYRTTKQVAEGGSGSTNIDTVHRQLLDEMLETDKWKPLSTSLSDNDRTAMTGLWHKLNGWPDTTEGLYALKKKAIIATLSNGSARLLIDVAKHADLPWDAIFSGDIIGAYKPNPKMYLGAPERLQVDPTKCAMVAAHIYDLRAAAKYGLKTVYVRRPTEDNEEIHKEARSKAEGGEFDVVVDSFVELASVLNISQ